MTSELYNILADCGAPQPPTNGKLGGYLKTTERSNVTFQCNDGYFPSTTMVTMCISGMWDPSPAEHNCTESE